MKGAWRVWAVLGGALALVIAVVAALGGFSDAAEASLPKIQLGDVHHGSEVDTVITSVQLSTRAPGRDYDADEGVQYVLVEATLLNTTDDPGSLTSELVRVLLDGKISANDPSNGLVDPRTGNQVRFLQPGIPLDAVFWWEVDDSVQEGDEIIVGLFDHFPVDDPRFGDTAYTAPTPTARILTTVGASR